MPDGDTHRTSTSCLLLLRPQKLPLRTLVLCEIRKSIHRHVLASPHVPFVASDWHITLRRTHQWFFLSVRSRSPFSSVCAVHENVQTVHASLKSAEYSPWSG